MKRVFLGIDAGFSATVRSTGVCVLQPGSSKPVRCQHVKTQFTTAAIEGLLAGVAPYATSIDGPLVASALNAGDRYMMINRYRRCEQLLSGGIFQKRCKPGPTNSPRGQALHRQATLLANQMLALFPQTLISESFPNAFMGVMLPDSVYRKAIRRGIKSDVFWEYCMGSSRLMVRLISHVFGSQGAAIFRECRKLDDHDERAAFICALTASIAHEDQAFLVDGGADGAIVLPPEKFIQPWAIEVLRARCGVSKFVSIVG